MGALHLSSFYVASIVFVCRSNVSKLMKNNKPLGSRNNCVFIYFAQSSFPSFRNRDTSNSINEDVNNCRNKDNEVRAERGKCDRVQTSRLPSHTVRRWLGPISENKTLTLLA